MTFDATRACELLVGLDDMAVLAVEGADNVLMVLVESTQRVVGCAGCGTATVKDRPEVPFGDLACFGRPTTLVWRKVRWSCPEADCPVGSWTETNPQVAAPRCGLTRRAGLWACRQVGYHGRAVSRVAEELACRGRRSCPRSRCTARRWSTTLPASPASSCWAWMRRRS